MIARHYEPLDQYIDPNKVLVIYGPRRVGKTTLLQSYLATVDVPYLAASGDDLPTQQLLSSLEIRSITEYLEGYQLLAIDEAQNVPNIGQALKIIVDQIPGIRVIATGSSSFELAGQIGEPLTGRKRTLILYPLSQAELRSEHNRHELRQRLDEYLIYGTYPEVATAETARLKAELVREVANSYLLKDILAFDRIRNSRKLWDLLKLLAFQIGGEVSLNELASSLAIDVKTVDRYLDLLQQSFVLYRLSGFSRNLRKEVTQKAKYYFIDCGIRNAIVAQFNPLDLRDDVGQLWENFLVMERVKQNTYSLSPPPNLYFWRTYDQQEIDLVEQRGDQLDGLEFKWSARKPVKPPRDWAGTYPGASYSIVSPDNYLDLVLGSRTATEP